MQDSIVNCSSRAVPYLPGTQLLYNQQFMPYFTHFTHLSTPSVCYASQLLTARSLLSVCLSLACVSSFHM